MWYSLVVCTIVYNTGYNRGEYYYNYLCVIMSAQIILINTKVIISLAVRAMLSCVLFVCAVLPASQSVSMRKP